MNIVTCDPWKCKCGGVPRNSFVIAKLSPQQVDREDRHFCDRMILGRVTDSVPTPVERDIQSTVFEIHKVQAILDPFTQKELQWSALKASIVGTYYDTDQDQIAFGNDVDTFFAPHAYEVYVPAPDDLESLINSFVRADHAVQIGWLRYTETPPPMGYTSIPVRIDPDDFIGYGSGNRTALFGKTRMGKSNAIKVISDAVFQAAKPAAQLISDPSGEYTYINEQDGASLFYLHRDRSVRYSLSPRLPREEEEAGLERPRPLRVNFYQNVHLGHDLIRSLFSTRFRNRPNYMVDVLEWDPVDPDEAPALTDDPSEHNRYWRSCRLWWAALDAAGYSRPADQGQFANVLVPLQKPVKQWLAQQENRPERVRLHRDASPERLADRQPLSVLRWIYTKIYDRQLSHPSDFPDSDGRPYFGKPDFALLRVLGDRTISGTTYLTPFRDYDHVGGANVFDEIVTNLEGGASVFVDYSNATEEVAQNLSERIAARVLARMMDLFALGEIGERYIIMYFEEAHRLFRADDKDLSSVYNRLAKEGAKFHIGMVYATQSMTTLSPDLLKNTENFLIAHLDDDREIREVTRKYAFRDVADDIQRIMSNVFVRMITLSHRFALPVQLRKFEPRSIADASELG
jgi:Helicase HerA, central domain